MNTVIIFYETATSCGNIYRAHASVQGKAFTFEMDLNRSWVNIIDSDSRVESCAITEGEDVVSEGGEYVTENWTESDWKNLTSAVRL